MMSAPRRYRTVRDLPAVIPVFPLTGALLLPRARLPLNIFEPRYLAMVEAAMASYRIIGMIQPKIPGEEEHTTTKPALNAVGCAGRIVEYAETDDGRYLITLLGIARFRVAGERDSETPFRQVAADYSEFARDLKLEPEALAENAAQRDKLVKALKPYLTDHSMQTDWKSIEEAPVETLVSALAMICPFDPREKQALLEAPSVKERADALIALLEMSNAAHLTARGPKQPLH
jgi:Lon protease-like protein